MAFRKGLGDAGFEEGRNVTIEFRWADGHYDRLPGMAADLIGRQVAVITTPLSTPATLAAKAATTTIPIVFTIGSDPIALGLVPSLSHPGGNVTGVTSLNSDLAAKRLGLLRSLVPLAAHFFALIHPDDPLAKPFADDLNSAAAASGIHVEFLHATTPSEIDATFAGIPRQPGNVMMVSTNSLFYIRREQIAALAARNGVPASFDDANYVRAGGLISYGADSTDEVFQCGFYVGRVLKGEKPADLPVVQETKFILAINTKTAKALGIAVPPTLLAIADEVIE